MNKFMLKTTILAVALILATTAMAFAQTAAPENQFTVSRNSAGTGMIITGYTGTGGAIVIPARIQNLPVVEIGNNAFNRSRAVRDITSITIPSGVTKIGNSAFWQCIALRSVTIPNTVTVIDDDAFNDCKALTRITIPNSVTSIGECAFMVAGLKTITIPSSVAVIGDGAFYDCTSLTTITIQRTSMTSLKGSNVFYGVPNLQIRVPAGSVDAYKTAANWSAHANRIVAQ